MQRNQAQTRYPGYFETWVETEGIPIHEETVGVYDITELPREPWARTGGLGTYIKTLGSYQAEQAMYVLEIPPGQALEPEHHLYEELIWVLKGAGATEIRQHHGESKSTFEWRQGSVFAPPLNTWHRLINATQEPVLLFGISKAPRVMNSLHDAGFVFGNDHDFTELYGGEEEYFSKADKFTMGRSEMAVWETNFIADARSFGLDAFDQKVKGGLLTGYRMGKHWPNGHISEWEVGIYHKAHRHGPGAVILGLNGKGYVLAWPHESGGARPYQNGFGEGVYEIPWGPMSIYVPPDNWYHQHFNTGAAPARHIAVYGGTDRPAVRDFGGFSDIPVLVSERDGGGLIDYEDEDPFVREHFEAALAREGLHCTMEPINYR